jgi:hypothetical protein
MSEYFQNFPLTQYDVYFDGQRTDVVDIFRTVKVKSEYKDNVTFYTFYNIQDGERPDVVSSKLYGSSKYFWTFFMINDNLVNYFSDWPLSNQDMQELIAHKYEGITLLSDEDISTKFTKNTIFEGLISGARARLIDKDPNLGLLRVEIISGRFAANEIVRDSLTNEFVVIKGQIAFADAIHHYENADGKYVNKNTIGATPITNTEYEFDVNDKKTKIKVLRPAYVQVIADQFIEQIRVEEE